jgi:hypothetical protein
MNLGFEVGTQACPPSQLSAHSILMAVEVRRPTQQHSPKPLSSVDSQRSRADRLGI